MGTDFHNGAGFACSKNSLSFKKFQNPSQPTFSYE